MQRRDFTPRDYQRAMVAHALELERASLWAGMGLGKTVSALTALDAMTLVDDSPALVLAPLRVAVSTWPDEAAKWSHLAGVEVVPVVGNAKERAAALKRPATVYTTNYENLPWLVEHVGKRWPFPKVVADESTRLKSFRLRGGSVRAAALRTIAHSKIRYWLNLTGTPSPNGLADLWGQQWFVDAGARLGRTVEAFRERWFAPRVEDGERVTWYPLPHAQKQIEAAVRDVCLSLEAGDYFDLPELVSNVVKVELPPKARRHYRELERELYTSIGEHELEAFNAASRTLKCLQLCNGAAYVDDLASSDEHPRSRKWIEVHDAKLAALESIVAESGGEPILVAYHFRSDLARLQRAFPRARVLDKDPRTIRDWNAGKIRMLLAHPDSAGHGLNLQDGGRILVFFALWWKLESYLQILERIGPTRQAQAGHPRTVYVHHIVAADTVDELVLARHTTKRAVQDLLMEACKRRASP